MRRRKNPAYDGRTRWPDVEARGVRWWAPAVCFLAVAVVGVGFNHQPAWPAVVVGGAGLIASFVLRHRRRSRTADREGSADLRQIDSQSGEPR